MVGRTRGVRGPKNSRPSEWSCPKASSGDDEGTDHFEAFDGRFRAGWAAWSVVMKRLGHLSTFLVPWLVAGCAARIGADRVTTRQAYAQVQANALRTAKPSASTVAILHRFELDRLATRQADEAVRQLHQKALATGEEVRRILHEHVKELPPSAMLPPDIPRSRQ